MLPCRTLPHGGPGPHPAGPIQSNHRLNTLQAFGAVLPSCLPHSSRTTGCWTSCAMPCRTCSPRTGLYTRLPAQRRCRPGVVRSPFSATHVSNEQPRSGRLNLTGAGLFSFPPLPQKPFITECHLPVGTVPFLSVSAPTPFLLKRFMVRSTPWVPNDRTASDAIPMTLRSVSFSSGSHSPST